MSLFFKCVRLIFIGGLLALVLLAAGCEESKETATKTGKEKAPKEVVVYSSRTEELIKPAFDAFTKETGIKVKFTTAKEAELLERLKAEGDKSPADMLITVDVGNLWLAAEKGVFQPVESEELEQNVPEKLRDPDNLWFALTIRSRPIMYSTERVKPEELSTYEALGDGKWKGRLGLRTSTKVYNQSLIASMIASQGVKKAEETVKGWMANEPIIYGSDVEMLEAMAAGQVDVGIANTYYLARLIKDKPDFPVTVFWPNQKDRGAHVNVSGAGITKHAPNKENAVKLLEFLSSIKAQKLFADTNIEYPINPDVKPHEILVKWGEFKQDDLNVVELGRNQAEAVRIADRAGYK